MKSKKIILPIHEEDQINEYYCGPAAIVMVLRQLGISATQQQCAKFVRTKMWYGTDVKQMQNAFDRYSVRSDVFRLSSIQQLRHCLDDRMLCIVLYQGWGNRLMIAAGYGSHYGVVCGYDADHVYIADPYRRREDSSHPSVIHPLLNEDFEKKWFGRVGPTGTMVRQWMLAVPLDQSVAGLS